MASSSRRDLTGWTIAALAAAGGVGALALANWLAAASAGEARSALDGEPARFSWKHGTIFYVARGRGEPLVLVHGVYAGASSFEYRRIFTPLAQRFRVYAFDLLGFGLSDRPAVVYTPALYEELIQDFVRQVVGGMDHPARVMASTLGAAFLIRAAAAQPQLFDRLVLIEPTGYEDLAGDATAPLHRAQRALLRTPLAGQAIYNAIASRPSIRYFLRQTYGSAAAVSDDLVDSYYAMAHQAGARFAPASFLAGTLDTPVDKAYPTLPQPMLLAWGKNARFTPLEHARAFREANPRAELRVFDCGALPQEQAAAEFLDEVGAWLPASGSYRSR